MYIVQTCIIKFVEVDVMRWHIFALGSTKHVLCRCVIVLFRVRSNTFAKMSADKC